MFSKIRNIIRKVLFPNTYSSEAFLNFLSKKGVSVGSNCIIYSPNNTNIDIQRPEMLHIGNFCRITRGVTILCHDYSMSVARRKFHSFVGTAAETYIGDNVFIGMNATILMGTRIGNNCIVGAGAVVSGDFKDDSVIAGNPAKVICSIDGYYKKHLDRQYDSAKAYFFKLYENKKRIPTVEEMGNAFAWMYLPRNKEAVEKYNRFFRLGGESYEDVVDDFLCSKGMFESYDDFVKAVLR